MPTECNKKISVLVAADHAGYNGKIAGIGRYLTNILPRLDQKRFNVILVILRDSASLETELEAEGIKIIQLKRHKFDPFTLYDFIKIIKEENVDVLHLHQYGSSNFGRIAGKITGIPTILHAHGPDLNYPVYQRIADWLLAKQTPFTLAVSKSTNEECIRNRSIRQEKIFILPNGIPLEHFKPPSPSTCDSLKSQWDIPLNAPVIGTVTRFHEEKGNRYLLESAIDILKILPNTRFLLVGEGPLLEQLRELAHCLGIEHNIIFTGYQRDVIGMLSIFDLIVITSLSEGHPQSIIEAMAMEKAIVATDVSGINEILIDGVTGLLIPPRDPHALAEKVIHLLKNEQERATLGKAAYKKSREYSIGDYVRRLEKVYAGQINLEHMQAELI